MKKLNARYLLPILILCYSMNFMDRSVLSIVGDALKADLALSDGQLGLLHSILLITLIFLLLPGAALNDLIGRRRMLSIAAALWTCAMALTGTASGFLHLVCARALGSINEATLGAGGTAWLSSFYPPHKRGRIIGFFQMSAPLGMAMGTLLGGVLLALTGSWRVPFFIFLLPGILCVFALPCLPDNQPAVQKDYFKILPELFKRKTLIYCGIGAGFYSIAKFAYQTWLPVLILRSYEGLSPWLAGTITGSFLLVGVFGPIIGGTFSDSLNQRSKAGRIYAIVLCMTLVVSSKFLLYFLVGNISLPLLCAYGLFDGLLTMMPLPIYFTMAQDVVDDRVRSGACGVLGTLIYLSGGAWGPLLIGFLSDLLGGGAEGLRTAMMSLLGFMALSILIFFMAKNVYIKEKM